MTTDDWIANALDEGLPSESHIRIIRAWKQGFMQLNLPEGKAEAWAIWTWKIMMKVR